MKINKWAWPVYKYLVSSCYSRC